MTTVQIISLIFSIVLLLIAFVVPFIMSILDPKSIPDNLSKYYSSKKTWGLIIALGIAVVLIGILWGCVLGFNL